MSMIRFKSKIEQAADYLRGEIHRGRWAGEIPGRHELSTELGINGKTVEAALKLLVRDGILKSQGTGKRRRILDTNNVKTPSLRVAVLNYDPASRAESYIVDMMHLLRLAGHVPVAPRKTLLEIDMNVERVARLVADTPADAWVVVGGSSEVLEWFVSQNIPAFAMFGRRRHIPMASAGPDKPPATRALTKHLIELGHRRIVLIARAERRLPQPGATERAFLETLESCGISPGAYHMPDWEESAKGLQQCLRQLFRLTPPTALIVDEAPLFTAIMQFATRMRLGIPDDISLVCCDWNPHFQFCEPQITHIGWDIRPVVRRAVRWANNISLGVDDRKQTNTRSKFVIGGSIGPVRKRELT